MSRTHVIPRRARRFVAPLAFGVVSVAACGLLVPTLDADALSSATADPGVTKRTITVGGIVGSDGASQGADIGARARFARANRANGVHGRTIEYLRTEAPSEAATANAAAMRLANSAFAVVPAIAPSVGASTLTSAGVPFFGIATSAEWHASRTGFSVIGVSGQSATTAVNPGWPVQLRALLGRPRAATVVPVTDDAQVAAAFTAPAGKANIARFRAAGFVVNAPVVLAATSDLGATARTITTAAPAPAVALVLASVPTTTAFARQLAVAGYTGTVAVSGAVYASSLPSGANGLTMLVPIATVDEATPANRQLAAAVERFAPGTAITPAIAAGYWSADFFVRALASAGATPTRASLLKALNGAHFTYRVPGTVGRSTWPEMHAQPVPCGSLVQSDGRSWLVIEPYSCAVTASSSAK
ncbi:MAG: ABC transporter substrate-binding protein [Acidimicrobiia bacterium]